MVNFKRQPGCNCCFNCPTMDCKDGTFQAIRTVTYNIAGLPSTLEFWRRENSDVWRHVTLTNFGDQFNGSYVATKNRTTCLWENTWIEFDCPYSTRVYSQETNSCPIMTSTPDTTSGTCTVRFTWRLLEDARYNRFHDVLFSTDIPTWDGGAPVSNGADFEPTSGNYHPCGQSDLAFEPGLAFKPATLETCPDVGTQVSYTGSTATSA